MSNYKENILEIEFFNHRFKDFAYEIFNFISVNGVSVSEDDIIYNNKMYNFDHSEFKMFCNIVLTYALYNNEYTDDYINEYSTSVKTEMYLKDVNETLFILSLSEEGDSFVVGLSEEFDDFNFKLEEVNVNMY